MSGPAPEGMPEDELAVRKKLGQALVEFVTRIMSVSDFSAEPPKGEEPGKMIYDRPMLEHVVENFRIEVEAAAAQGIEVSLCWSNLGTWTNEGRERIGCFARALHCLDQEERIEGETTTNARWSRTHSRAECLYEIGRVHAHEGDPQVARDFLSRALPLAQEADRLRAPAGIEHEDYLEGQIAELLVQLPDEITP